MNNILTERMLNFKKDSRKQLAYKLYDNRYENYHCEIRKLFITRKEKEIKEYKQIVIYLEEQLERMIYNNTEITRIEKEYFYYRELAAKKLGYTNFKEFDNEVEKLDDFERQVEAYITFDNILTNLQLQDERNKKLKKINKNDN